MNSELIVPQGPANFRAALTAKQAVQFKQELAEFVKEAMEEKVDYDVLPGTDKPTLLQPGADKLCNFYGLTSETEVRKEIVDHEAEYIQFDYTCSIFWHRPMADGQSFYKQLIARRDGSCNSKEEKYRWRYLKAEDMTAAQKLLLQQGKLEAKGRPEWMIEFKLQEQAELFQKAKQENWKKEQRKAKSGKIFWWYLNPASSMYRVANDAVFELLNTIMKMGQKRAYVAATIAATKAHDLFTQDIEEMADFNKARRESEEKAQDDAREAAQAREAAAPQAQAGQEDQRPASEQRDKAPKQEEQQAEKNALLQGYEADLKAVTKRSELNQLWEAFQEAVSSDKKLTPKQVAEVKSAGWQLRTKKATELAGQQ